MEKETKEFMLEGEPHPDMDIKEFVKITEDQRLKAHDIIQNEFTSEDRIDEAHIDKDPSSDKTVLLIKVNKGNVGSNTIEEIFSLK